MKYFVLICLLCTNLLSMARVVDNRPARTIEDVSDGIIVTYFFDNPEIVESEYYENTKYIRYDGFGLNDNDGEPCIPFRNDTYLVPNNCTVTVNVLDSAFRDTTFVMSPSIPLMPDDNSPVSKHVILPYTGFFPTNTILCHGVYQYREDALISVLISPVKYNYQTNTVRRYSYIKYKLTYSGTNYEYKGKSTSLARKICQNTLPNRANTDSTIRDDRHYLIITTTEYKNSLDEFIKWKRLKGFNVYIADTTKGDWNVSSVKRCIQNHFPLNNTDSIKYLLIVGDVDDVPPSETFIEENKIGVTDHPYGLPNSTSNIPQISRGRIPVNNTTELSTILHKIIKYEQTPIIDSVFYNTALHLAHFQDGDGYPPTPKNGFEDRAFTLCAEDLKIHMEEEYGKEIIRGYFHEDSIVPTHWNNDFYSNGRPIPQDLNDSVYNWNFSPDDIKNTIEAGTFYVLYRGHGEEGNWACPHFNGRTNQTLSNGDKLPFIFSVACYTGRYNFEYNNCLTEILLKTQGGGCVGMIAASHNVRSGYNDAMAFGMFDAIWPGLNPTYKLIGYRNSIHFADPTYEVGDVMDLGLFRMRETLGNNSNMWKRYHCFGDPSMMLYTENPQHFEDPIIRVTGDTLYVNVHEEGCRINIVNKTTDEVQSYLGNNMAQYVGNDDISVCIDKHNYVPYVWHKNVYIQNENIVASEREYHAKNVKVGNHVTDQKPQGNVTMTNSNVTIKADNIILDKGTSTNLGSTLKIYSSH